MDMSMSRSRSKEEKERGEKRRVEGRREERRKGKEGTYILKTKVAFMLGHIGTKGFL